LGLSSTAAPISDPIATSLVISPLKTVNLVTVLSPSRDLSKSGPILDAGRADQARKWRRTCQRFHQAEADFVQALSAWTYRSAS